MNVHHILFQLRKKFGLPQIALSQFLHISKTCYSRYENGKRKVPLEVCDKLIEFYVVDPSIFFLECIEMYDWRSYDDVMKTFCPESFGEETCFLYEFEKGIRSYEEYKEVMK